MLFTVNLTTPILIAIIVSSVLAFILLVILFYFLWYRNKKLRRQVTELDRRYEYLHSLLLGQDDQYIKRIDYISQVNLLYKGILEDSIKKYNDIALNIDKYIERRMSEVKDHLYEKRYNQLRKELPDFKTALEQYEGQVNKLNNDLLQVIKPEEECNHMESDARESFRLIKQDYTAHQQELAILKNSYEAVFDHVENLFNQFHDSVEQANYDEAEAMMPNINKILIELDKINKAMPSLCRLVTLEVPQKIGDLESEYRHMVNDGCPVHHLITDTEIEAMKNKVDSVIHDLKNFKYKNSANELKEIVNTVDKIIDGFSIEKENRAKFQEEIVGVNTRATNIEKSFIKLCNSIPKIRQVYVIEDDKLSMRNTIQAHINKIGRSKRSLDTYINSTTKQPFSILLKKTIELRDEASTIEKEMSDFKQYLSSLKTDVESAHELISDYFYRLRKAEKILRDSNIAKFQNKYTEKIEEIYKALESINSCSMIKPIKVSTINDNVSYLKFQGDSILNSIEQDANMMKLAESTIVFLNKERGSYADLSDLISQTENMFYDGEFERSYTEASNILKRFREAER